MAVDTRILVFPIRLLARNSFAHDGTSFRSFEVRYFKDVPLQRSTEMEIAAVRGEGGWRIRLVDRAGTRSRELPGESFEEARNLISRLVRPEAVLRPGEARKARSLDPLTLEVSEIETHGVGIETVEFQGRRRQLFVMETRAPDGDVRVKKFSNGLIYRSQTSEGYALLKAARMPDFWGTQGYFPRASFRPKPSSMVPAMRFSQAPKRGLARMRSAAKRVIEITTAQ